MSENITKWEKQYASGYETEKQVSVKCSGGNRQAEKQASRKTGKQKNLLLLLLLMCYVRGVHA